MKHTVIALILFVLLVLLVAVNAMYVNSVKEQLYKGVIVPDSYTASELPAAKESAGRLASMWKQERGRLGLSINENDLARIDEVIAELCAAADASEYASFNTAREKLRILIARLNRGERIKLF